MTDASTTGAVERAIQVIAGNAKPLVTLTKEEADALVSERYAAIQRAEAAERAADAAWKDAIEAAEAAYAQGFAAIRALRRAAPTEGEAQSLDDTTRAVLDRAERIVAGQSQQEQRTAEIFLRPTEGEA